MIVKKNSVSIEPFHEVDPYGNEEPKFGHKIVINDRYETLVTIFDKLYPIFDISDLEVLSFVNLVVSINTIESYWPELKKQSDMIGSTGMNKSIINDIFYSEQIQSIDDGHKRWFRDKKLEDLIDVDVDVEEWEGIPT